ncbi:MAG: hypothetical protein ABI835_04545 [Chloroflexota bacterium]
MVTIWVKMTLGLLALLTGLVGAARLLPYAEHPLQRLIAPPPGCPVPCWQGIRPDTTSYQDAIDLLEHNPNIIRIDTRQVINASSPRYLWYIYWEWHDDSGDPITGSLTVQTGIVRQVRIYKRIPFGLLWVLLGEPAQGAFVGRLIYHDQQPVTLPIYHLAGYPDSGITVQTDSSCGRFWWQPSMLTVRGVAEIGAPYNLGTYRRYACQGWDT